MQVHTWKLYSLTSEIWEAMLEDCARATRSIDIEQYIFMNDEIGKRFIQLLQKKATEKVKVRLLCDMAGSFGLFNSSEVKILQNAGVEVLFFNTISPWAVRHIPAWFFRDHRKIFVVDSTVAYVGGVNFGSYMKDWQDSAVRITGPVIRDIEHVFNWLWIITRRERFVRFRRRNIDVNQEFDFLPNIPYLRQRLLYHTLISQMEKAKTYMYFTTPYFVPDLRFFRILRKAARKKIDVRLLIPWATEHPVVDIAGRSYFDLALKAGVRIFRYKSNIIHAKTAIIDGTWATVGSMNLDNLSFLFNYEANIVSGNMAFAEDVRNQFLKNIEHAEEVTRSTWEKRSRYQKIGEVLSWPIHKFM